MTIHFISGLPRSGSTLLAAILRQNPRFRAGVASPLYGMCMAIIQLMGAGTEYAGFFSDARRRAMLTALFDAFHQRATPDRVAFDTARLWSGKLELVASLYPAARVICCVRDPRGILDSIERICRANPLQSTALFQHEPNTSVFVRAASSMEPVKGFVGGPWSALREAWFSELAGRLIVLRYESLAAAPADSMDRLYRALEEAPFAHDLARLDYAEPEYDARLGLPGLHRIAGPVQLRMRPSLLPPELAERYANLEFWQQGAPNPRGVLVI